MADMEIGLVGLGRMGFNMRERLRAGGVDVVGFDRDATVSDVESLAALVDRVSPPRVVWLMVPVDVTSETIDALSPLLSPGDVVVDGGNGRFTEDRPRERALGARGIGYLDVGVSGGVWGRTEGYALMVGGERRWVEICQPVFDALKPPGDFGFVHAGPSGAGHYAKMVHNGIEYGLMQAYAEGYELLTASGLVEDVPGTVRSWRSGTVIRSWLLDLFDRALADDPELSQLTGYTEDTGEGRWTMDEAVRLAVPLNAISASLFARFRSRQEDSPQMKAIAALRSQFGGHAVKRG